MASSPTSDSSQSPPRSRLPPSITLRTPSQSDCPTDQDDDLPLPLPSQSAHPTTSTSSTHVPPLQTPPDRFPPHAHSHYRSHLTDHGQRHPSDFSDDKNQAKPIAQTSVVLRTTTLVPSSPLLKSTVITSRASDEAPHRDRPIQADPKSPYYTFQDTRLIPNPIIRIYMATNANPKMFSVQNISPDTLSLLL